MNKIISKSIHVILLAIFLFTNFIVFLPSNVSAKSTFSEQEARSRLSELARNVIDGKKVSIKKTISKDTKGSIKNKFVAFIKKDRVDDVLKNIEAKSSSISQYTYGEVVAVPLVFENNEISNENLIELDNNPDVIAITQAVERIPMAITAPNDPLFSPTNVYDVSVQWNLNKPLNGNYGIDLYSAWEYLDSQSKQWQGDSNVLVAVIDTGVTYENGTKYGTWEFTKPTEMTDSIYVNSDETATNNIDDDNNGYVDDYLLSSVKYCLDSNSNGQCDSPSERTKSVIDDVNSFSIVDYQWYWDPFNELTSSNCTNAPYTDYRCVAQRYCETISPPSMDYWGCYDGDMSKAYDLNGHGTSVTNIIAGKINNSVGGVGIAPNISILPISLFGYYYNSGTWTGSLGGDSVGVATAVEYAVSAGADIINMSFGGPSYDLFEELAMNRAYYEEDVLLVAASGNTGTAYGDVAMYPANYKSVVSVGATNMDGTRASYSIYKSDVEISAPVGTGIYTQSYTCYFTQNCLVNGDNTQGTPNRFEQFSIARTAGTSFAAPQVSAVAALLRSAYPEMTASNIRNILRMSSTPIGSRYNSTIGYGVLNANNAVRLVDNRGIAIGKERAVVQATRGTDGKLKTRYSLDGGIRWTGWSTGYTNYDEVGMPSNIDSNKFIMYVRGYQDQLWQTIGSIQNDKLVTESFSRMSYSLSSPRAYVFDNMLLLMFRGNKSIGLNRVFYRRSSDLATSWTRWLNTGYATHAINMAQDPVSKKIVQTTRGTNGRVMTRLFTLNGNGWYGWQTSNYTTGEVGVVRGSSYFIQAMRGTDGYLYTRRSKDGNYWYAWLRSNRMTNDVSMAYTGSRIYQAIRGSDNKVYLRYSTNDGKSWTAFSYFGISSITSPTLHYDTVTKRLFFSTVHTNGKVYTRYSDNGGSNWSAWESSISANKDVTFSSITYGQ